MTFIELKNIDVTFDKKKKILDGLNLEISEGQLVSLLGPSGCGKTTTLRVMAGFVEPARGQFLVNQKDYTKIPIHMRNFGIVFQSYALFPHMTVEDNIAFGLQMRKTKKAEIAGQVRAMMDVVDLQEYGKRYPQELSGGQRQRVALARALVVNPEILLLDEPLSNLDAKLRLKMRVEIRELQKKMGITTVFVTHDQEECFSISDKVAVMNNGVIEQFDRPEILYSRPATEFVARFVGFENFLPLAQTGEYIHNEGSRLVLGAPIGHPANQSTGTIRPEDVIILQKEEPDHNVIEGKLIIHTYLGKSYQVKVKTPIGDLVVDSPNIPNIAEGERIRLYLPPEKIIIV